MDELSLYDLTRNELRRFLSDRFPVDFDLESTITAYAYWVCTHVHNEGKDWETTVQEYVDFAMSDAQLESQAEQIELDLLRQELRQLTGPLLDVGAGWGRFGALYAALGLWAFFSEPSSLGCRLLRRNGLTRSVCCLGQSLSFPTSSFRNVVIGWVLHHDAPDVPSTAILKEIGRVTAPGGRLLSIEPLSVDFGEQKWRGLVEEAGFEVEKLEVFFQMPLPEEKSERYGYLTAIKKDRAAAKG
ncbi:MAG: class I SAM-dependent methyltransferase [Anaerolineales bacterium]|nr:class I SAM-dependent methyltransferase [Anaerolineales bacterium]